MDEKLDLKELERRLEAVKRKPENLPIQLNPNCFIDGFDCDVDPNVVLKVFMYIYLRSVFVQDMVSCMKCYTKCFILLYSLLNTQSYTCVSTYSG
jgi:hypothetical protein